MPSDDSSVRDALNHILRRSHGMKHAGSAPTAQHPISRTPDDRASLTASRAAMRPWLPDCGSEPELPVGRDGLLDLAGGRRGDLDRAAEAPEREVLGFRLRRVAVPGAHRGDRVQAADPSLLVHVHGASNGDGRGSGGVRGERVLAAGPAWAGSRPHVAHGSRRPQHPEQFGGADRLLEGVTAEFASRRSPRVWRGDRGLIPGLADGSEPGDGRYPGVQVLTDETELFGYVIVRPA